MVFSKYYDMALWLMLYGNKREDIIHFIECIPAELLKKIQKTLSLYQDYLVGNRENCLQNEEMELSGKVITSGDMLYWYSLDIETGTLDMGESIVDGDKNYNTFQMTLHPLKRKHYMNLENFEEHLLGDVSYYYAEEYVTDELKLMDFDTMDFRLFKLPLGVMMLHSGEISSCYKNGNFPKNRYGFVNVRKIPKDYNVSDIRNKHVRCRRINNGSK